jgi:hypothetical protein
MDILDTLVGAILAILTTIWIESLRKPSLRIYIHKAGDANYTDRPAKKARFLYVELVNQPLPKVFRWLSRNAALQCHGTINFHHLDGTNVFGRAMQIRWTNLPEPTPAIFVIGEKRFPFFDPRKFDHFSRVDIYPGESEILNVASRFDEDEDCFGWSNESYYIEPIWRNPNWKLSKGRYLVNITVISAGEKCEGLFRLINDVGINDFRLEKALPSDTIQEL